MPDILSIAGHDFASRLFVGTGKFTSPQIMRDALEASGTEMVTVALRRVDLDSPEPNLLEFIARIIHFMDLPWLDQQQEEREARWTIPNSVSLLHPTYRATLPCHDLSPTIGT